MKLKDFSRGWEMFSDVSAKLGAGYIVRPIDGIFIINPQNLRFFTSKTEAEAYLNSKPTLKKIKRYTWERDNCFFNHVLGRRQTT